MTFWLALRRLLPLLAVLSLALTPGTASAAAAGMRAPMAAQVAGDAMPGMAMDDMPCCPSEKPAKPDCAKPDCAKPDCAKAGCPLMALCLAGLASLLPAAVTLPAPAATRAAPIWPHAASYASLHGPPLPEPPRA